MTAGYANNIRQDVVGGSCTQFGLCPDYPVVDFESCQQQHVCVCVWIAVLGLIIIYLCLKVMALL